MSITIFILISSALGMIAGFMYDKPITNKIPRMYFLIAGYVMGALVGVYLK